MNYQDRRAHPRLEGQFRMDLLNMGDDPEISPYESVVPGDALDISRSGMRMKVTYRVPVGTFLSVIVYYKGHDSICLCEVVWRREMMGEQLYGLYVREWSKMDRLLENQLALMQTGHPAVTQSL